MNMNLRLNFPKWVYPIAWIIVPLIASIASFCMTIKLYHERIKNYNVCR